MKRLMLAVVLATAVGLPCVAGAVDVTPYTKRDGFEGIKLSPNGDYYAATVPMEGKSVLLIVHRSDNKPTGGFPVIPLSPLSPTSPHRTPPPLPVQTLSTNCQYCGAELSEVLDAFCPECREAIPESAK